MHAQIVEYKSWRDRDGVPSREQSDEKENETIDPSVYVKTQGPFLLLLFETLDPIAKTHARVCTLEALSTTALRRRKVASKENIDTFLDKSITWMRDEVPSRWCVRMEQKPSRTRHPAVNGHGAFQSVSKKGMSFLGFHAQHVPTRDHQTQEVVWLGSPRVFLRPPHLESVGGRGSPVPLHVINQTMSLDAERHRSNQSNVPIPSTQPQAPSRSTSPSAALGRNRHQKLLNQLGIRNYAFTQDKRHFEQRARERLVRNLREERERAMEALIADQRMLQCEKSTQVARIKLNIDVKLQRNRFEREREQLQARNTQERQRHCTRRRQLARKFEASFVAQSGALMRCAARTAVASSLKKDKQEQHELTASVKNRESEALARAKGVWFARKRHEIRAVRELCFAESGISIGVD